MKDQFDQTGGIEPPVEMGRGQSDKKPTIIIKKSEPIKMQSALESRPTAEKN